MESKPAMSHNACYASPLSNRAVPMGFNIDRFRFRNYVDAHSDVTKCRVYFFQYHGMYWYGVSVYGVPQSWRNQQFNSVPFVSIRNATVDCAALLRSLHFVNDTPRVFRQLVNQDKLERKLVAAELDRPTTRRT